MASPTYASTVVASLRTSSAEVKRMRRADREFGPWASRTPTGSSNNAPLKNMRARKSFISWMMTMFAPLWL